MNNKEKVSAALAELQAKILVKLYSFVSKFLLNLGRFSTNIEESFDEEWPLMYEALTSDKRRRYGVLLPYEVLVPSHGTKKFGRYSQDDFFFISKDISFGRSVDYDVIVVNGSDTFRTIVEKFMKDPTATCKRLSEFGSFLEVISLRYRNRDKIENEIDEFVRRQEEIKFSGDLKKIQSALTVVGDTDMG